MINTSGLFPSMPPDNEAGPDLTVARRPPSSLQSTLTLIHLLHCLPTLLIALIFVLLLFLFLFSLPLLVFCFFFSPTSFSCSSKQLFFTTAPEEDDSDCLLTFTLFTHHIWLCCHVDGRRFISGLAAGE